MALYLKYRPQDFESLVWQKFVKETLQMAVSLEKTVGVYLFCGPRWTGKTSTARILAKAVNCTQLDNGNPCNICKTCVGINDESLVDVIEMDAASHTWVDNIREIIEKAQFRPTQARYKVYIIDEVHMLSKGAFNALLKILEEPPEYVKFILATTETHKVPETIISRCQRYDMKSISIEDIIWRLTTVATKENIQIDTQSLEYIAQNSGGALRNALSLFEQLSSDWNITYNDIIEKLWIVEDKILDNFLQLLLTHNNEGVEIFEKLVADGKNMKLFFKEFLFFTKKQALVSLKAGKNITNYLTILSILDDTYAKTKISVDENTTFLIGILQIITDYTDEKIQVKNVSLTQGNAKNMSAKTEEVILSKNEISRSDINDVFWEENTSIIPEEKKSDVFHTDTGSSAFNAVEYLHTLKKNGAKAMVIMSIKGASIILKDTTLELHFKTKFALNSVNNPDTNALLNGGLVSMGMANVTVKLM